MDTWAWIVVVVAIVAAVVLVGWVVALKQRTRKLRSTFGDEYDRVVDVRGSKREAEHDLSERARRRDEIELRPLSAAAGERYASAWRETQTRFVDTPADAVREADALLTSLLREVGYPVDEFDEFDERADVVSVDHPDLTQRYRAAHGVAVANSAGQASTEDLRRAMVDYRSLFEQLLSDRVEA